MNFIKLHWKLIAGGIIALIVLVWIGSVTGMNRKLYDIALDNLRQDQGKIVKTLEGIVTERRKNLPLSTSNLNGSNSDRSWPRPRVKD